MSKNIDQVYIANPSTSVPDDALFYLGLFPYGTNNDSAINKQNLYKNIKNSNAVVFSNVLYIANNGNDTTGDGSLSNPLVSIAGSTGALSRITSQSVTNQYLIIDMRTGVITESNTALIPPFVFIKGNKSARYNGNIQLDITKFSAITTNAVCGWNGYYSIGLDSTSVMNLDFHTLPTTYLVTVYLEDIEAAILATGSQFVGTNNDPIITNPYATFTIIQNNFNTSFLQDNLTFLSSDILISNGISVQIFNSQVQITKIKKYTGTTQANTNVILNNIFSFIGDPVTGELLIDLTEGNGGQSVFMWFVNSSFVQLTSGLTLSIDNTPENTTFSFNYDLLSMWNLGTVINPTSDIAYLNFSTSEYLGCNFSPVNYTPTPITEDILTNGIDAQLNGIDLKLGTISSSNYPPFYIQGFQLTWNPGGPPSTLTVGLGLCADSNNSFDMDLATPVTLDTTSASIDNGGSWTSNSWYAIWFYENSTTFATTVKFSLNFSTPATIAGYDKIRFIGSARSQTTGTDILGVIQSGVSNDRTYTWWNSDPTLDVLTSGNAISGAPGTFSCASAMSPVADEINLQMRFTPGITKSGDTANITDSDFNTLPLVYISGPVGSILAAAPSGYVPVNSSQNLSYYVDDTSDNLDLISIGYKESL